LIGIALQEHYPFDQGAKDTLTALQKKLGQIDKKISDAVRLSAPGLKQQVRKQVVRTLAPVV
jgi:hypothetical protein